MQKSPEGKACFAPSISTLVASLVRIFYTQNCFYEWRRTCTKGVIMVLILGIYEYKLQYTSDKLYLGLTA
jgi:hypothetical protein